MVYERNCYFLVIMECMVNLSIDSMPIDKQLSPFNFQSLTSGTHCSQGLIFITNNVHRLKNSEPEPESSEPRLEKV